MSGGSILAIKVNLRTTRRVNPSVQTFRLALTATLVVLEVGERAGVLIPLDIHNSSN